MYYSVDDMTPEAIAEMKRMLREKEMKLTDIRLDALTSAHQLEQLRDAMSKMKVCFSVTLITAHAQSHQCASPIDSEVA